MDTFSRVDLVDERNKLRWNDVLFNWSLSLDKALILKAGRSSNCWVGDASDGLGG